MKRLTKIVLVVVFGIIVLGLGVGISYAASQQQPLAEEPLSWV